MLSREKEALFYDRRVILYSVQVFGSLGRNGVKNTCTAILGVFYDMITVTSAFGGFSFSTAFISDVSLSKADVRTLCHWRSNVH